MASQSQEPEPITGRITRSRAGSEKPASQSQPARGPGRIPKRKDERKSGEGPVRKKTRINGIPEEDESPAAGTAANGSARLPERRSTSTTLSMRPAGIRKTSGRSLSGGVAGILKESREAKGKILSKTSQYAIKQLPGLPDNLRKDPGVFKAHFQSLSTNTHEVIVTTPTSVLIWDYNTTTISPVPTTVRLPEPLSKVPLAATVPNATIGSSNNAGLVVVCTTTGKVWYWEELDTATTYRVYSRALKVNEGKVEVPFRDEILKMVPVEHGGYVVVTKGGHLSYLSLRDASGQVAVKVEELKDSTQSTSFFGSFRGLTKIVSGLKNTVAGIETRTIKNRFETIVMTPGGVLKVWETELNNSSSVLKEQLDLSEDLREAFKTFELIDANSKMPITVVDFATKKDRKSSSALSRGTEANTFALETVILAAVPNNEGGFNFNLVHVTVGNGKVDIKRVTPIHVYKHEKKSVINTDEWSLLVPGPGHTAYITWSNGVMLVSLADVYRDADMELKMGGVWQDVIYFQYHTGAEIISAASEFCKPYSSTEKSSLLLFTKEKGAVKIEANSPPMDKGRQSIMPKTKIEQEVFFGLYAAPILNFAESGAFAFKQSLVEDAALELSTEILRSANVNSDTAVPSMETQIYWREQQLRRLIDFVLPRYGPLSRATKWQLLWNAEKLDVAAKLWKVYEAWLAKKDDDEKILFPLFVKALTRPGSDLGEGEQHDGHVDLVREWFAHGIDEVGKLLGTIEGVILQEHKLQKGRWDLLEVFISEAQDVMKAVLMSAYDFRIRNKKAYGLEDETIEDGLLPSIDAYNGLNEPWTATKNVCVRLEGFVEATTNLLIQLSEEQDDPAARIDKTVLSQLRKHQWQLVLMSCLAHEERVRYLQSQPDEQERANGIRTKRIFEGEVRPQMLLGLAELGRGFDGMRIAEKMGDMDGLVRLCVVEIEYVTDPDERTRLSKPEQAAIDRQKEELYKRLDEYFATYGEAFAEAFFTCQIESGRLADLLEQDFGKGKQLTRFLNGSPDRWKLAWINQVTREKNLQKAGETLMRIANDKEPNIWAKYGEVSFGKLAVKAATGKKGKKKKAKAAEDDEDVRTAAANANAEEAEDLNTYATDTLSRRLERQDILTKAQLAIEAHVRPQFQLGVDDNGAVDVAMEKEGAYAVRDRPAMTQLLREGYTALNLKRTMAPELLIDVFTLKDSVTSDNEAYSIHGKEFVWACKVLDSTGWLEGKDTTKGEGVRGTIWKRLYVRDDWVRVHHTKGKRDREIQAKLKQTLLYKTLEHGVLEKIWTTTPAFEIPKPTEVLGSLSKPEDLLWRFPGEDDTIRKGVAADNVLEDELLTDYISRCRMAFHFEACMKLAVEAGEEAQKAREEREKARREAERKMREREAGIGKEGERGLVGELDEERYRVHDEEGEDGEDGEGYEEEEFDEERLTQEQADLLNGGGDEDVEMED